MSSYSTKTSTLGTQTGGRASGKKIETWTFTRPTSDRHPPKSTVDVHMLLLADRGLGFALSGKDLPAGDWTDTDIRRLHVKAEAALKEQDELHGGITWEPWLEVQTSLKKERLTARSFHVATGRDLQITYRPLLRGVHPNQPDRVLTVNSNGSVVDFPKPLTPDSIQEKRTLRGLGEAEGGSASFDVGSQDGRVEGDTYAYVPDTPSNRAALEQIFTGMENLGAKLHALLSPDAVVQSMANIGQSLQGLPLIEGPSTVPPRRPRSPG